MSTHHVVDSMYACLQATNEFYRRATHKPVRIDPKTNQPLYGDCICVIVLINLELGGYLWTLASKLCRTACAHVALCLTPLMLRSTLHHSCRRLLNQRAKLLTPTGLRSLAHYEHAAHLLMDRMFSHM